MKRYYECHITFTDPNWTSDPDDTSTWAPREPRVRGWTYSRIDGDPLLGEGVKSYLTQQVRESTPMEDVVRRMEEVAARLVEDGFRVLRTKVELVVYDRRRR